MSDRITIDRNNYFVYVGEGGCFDAYLVDGLTGRALVELIERREADAAAGSLPPPTPITAALESCILARDVAKRALVEAISPKAHYQMTAAVTGITQILDVIEVARKADAS